MVGLWCKHMKDIEGEGLGFVCLIHLARLNEVLVALHRVLTSYNKEVGGALYLIPIRGSVVELHNRATAIWAPLEWKDCDFSVHSSEPGINLGMVGQGSKPLFEKSPIHYGALRGPVLLREVHSYIMPFIILQLLVTPLVQWFKCLTVQVLHLILLGLVELLNVCR